MIALGGGSVLSERVRVALEPHVVVLLDVDAERAWERVGAPPEATPGELGRPLARDREAFLALHAQRRELYEEHADAIVPSPRLGERWRGCSARCTRSPPRRPARACCGRAAPRASTRCSSARGLLRALGADESGELWPLDRARSRAFCVTDETVAELYGEQLPWLAGRVAIARRRAAQDARAGARRLARRSSRRASTAAIT